MRAPHAVRARAAPPSPAVCARAAPPLPAVRAPTVLPCCAPHPFARAPLRATLVRAPVGSWRRRVAGVLAAGGDDPCRRGGEAKGGAEVAGGALVVRGGGWEVHWRPRSGLLERGGPGEGEVAAGTAWLDGGTLVLARWSAGAGTVERLCWLVGVGSLGACASAVGACAGAGVVGGSLSWRVVGCWGVLWGVLWVTGACVLCGAAVVALALVLPWLFGCLVVWLSGCLVGCGCLVVGRGRGRLLLLVGWLVGWLVVCWLFMVGCCGCLLLFLCCVLLVLCVLLWVVLFCCCCVA